MMIYFLFKLIMNNISPNIQELTVKFHGRQWIGLVI